MDRSVHHDLSAAASENRVCARCVMERKRRTSASMSWACAIIAPNISSPIAISRPIAALSAAPAGGVGREGTRSGRGKPYDCIIGIRAGSTAAGRWSRRSSIGLRPLAVHMDNGWNAELAQNNIANLVRGLGVDLHTHVIEWTEYRGLMEAFFAPTCSMWSCSTTTRCWR